MSSPVTAPLPPSALDPGPPALALSGVAKSYGPVRAVRGIDLQIAAGEIVALLGPNGAGKSTTNEMILGLVAPDAGRVEVFGADPLVAVRQGRVGAMLQNGALLADARVLDLLRLMHGLHAHPMALPEVIHRAGVGDFLKTRTDKLSGGQAQRVRYALALLPDPDLLILDEPTVGMDVEIRRAFWASMADFTETTTRGSTGARGGGSSAGSAEPSSARRSVVFATHYLDEADTAADRIVVLAHGAVVADGTGAEIKAQVSGRTISVAADSVSAAVVGALPGVTDTKLAGPRLEIHATDSDAVLRALLGSCPGVRDVEITSAKLEDAFLALTSGEAA